MQDTPPKGTESMLKASPSKNNESQQFLYLEEILTRLLREEWEGFDKRIKVWQKQRGYFKFGNT